MSSLLSLTQVLTHNVMWNKICVKRDKKSSSQSRSVVPEFVTQTLTNTMHDTLVFFLTHAIVVLPDDIYL